MIQFKPINKNNDDDQNWKKQTIITITIIITQVIHSIQCSKYSYTQHIQCLQLKQIRTRQERLCILFFVIKMLLLLRMNT